VCGAEDGCVQLFPHCSTLPTLFSAPSVPPELTEFSSQCNQANGNINSLLNKTSLSQGSRVRIKEAFIVPGYQRRGNAGEKNHIAAAPTQQRKRRPKKDTDERKLHYFSF